MDFWMYVVHLSLLKMMPKKYSKCQLNQYVNAIKNENIF